MITVRGIAIYVDELEILQTIKQQVYEQQGREILRKIKKSGNNIQVCCPVHNNGQERKLYRSYPLLFLFFNFLYMCTSLSQ